MTPSRSGGRVLGRSGSRGFRLIRMCQGVDEFAATWKAVFRALSQSTGKNVAIARREACRHEP